jgi:hypothetical protein
MPCNAIKVPVELPGDDILWTFKTKLLVGYKRHNGVRRDIHRRVVNISGLRFSPVPCYGQKRKRSLLGRPDAVPEFGFMENQPERSPG